jgi:RHS repeat-associated protein
MQMPERNFSSNKYRYGFNGKENDKDISEGGQDYGMRIYDARLGKFLSVDPLASSFPYYTPYQFAGNTPLQAVDLDGEEPIGYSNSSFKYQRDGLSWMSVSDAVTVESKMKGKWAKMMVKDAFGMDYTVYTQTTEEMTPWNTMTQRVEYYYLNNTASTGADAIIISGKTGEITGSLYKFETEERTQARLGSELANTLAGGFAGLLTLGAAAPLLPSIGGALVSTEGLAGATIKTELGRRLGAASADATIQGISIASGQQEKFNFGGTVGSLITPNPFGTAAWTTAGQAVNGEVKSGGDLISKFAINSVGNIVGDKMTKGLITNSSFSVAKNAVSNAKYSLFGNIGGNGTGFLIDGYKNLGVQNKDLDKAKNTNPNSP